MPLALMQQAQKAILLIANLRVSDAVVQKALRIPLHTAAKLDA